MCSVLKLNKSLPYLKSNRKMGKRKEARQPTINAKAKIKKIKTISKETVETNHDNHPMEVIQSGKLLGYTSDAKGNNANEEIKVNKPRNKKALKETENESKVIHEPQRNKNIFVDDEPQEPNKKSKKPNKGLNDTENELKVICESKSKKIIFFDDERQDVSNKKSKKRNKALQKTEKVSKVIQEHKVNRIIFVDDDEPQEASKKKSKKRKKGLQETEKESKVVHEHENKKIIFINDQPNELLNKRSKKRNKALQEIEKVSKVLPREPKAKKIIFVDESQKVTSSSATDASTVAHTDKKKKFLNEDEAEVREEDIDKFCDELSEEDNEQYEEWVKLIEANFNSNKKKPK